MELEPAEFLPVHWIRCHVSDALADSIEKIRCRLAAIRIASCAASFPLGCFRRIDVMPPAGWKRCPVAWLSHE